MRADFDPAFCEAVQTGDERALDATRIGRLVLLARQVLAAGFGEAAAPILDDEAWQPAFVNVTLRCNGHLCGSMGARAATLPQAVVLATQRAAADGRFNRSLVRADLSRTIVEVWIETGECALAGDAQAICGGLSLGLDGVRLRAGTSGAYYKPSVAITHEVETPERLLEKLCRKAGLSEQAWRDPDTTILRTSWVHAVETCTGGSLRLEGLRPLDQRPATLAEVRAAARLSVTRMLAIQKLDGSLGYIYQPFKDEWRDGNNRVRQAGCSYALARAAADPVTGDIPGLAIGAARALEFMMRQTAAIPAWTGRFVKETNDANSWGKLGATALTVLATAYPTGRPWREDAMDMVNTILALQQPDGSFFCAIGRDSIHARAQDFFPGESLLALARFALRTGDSRARDAIGRSFAYYKAHFRERPATAFVLWQTDTWTLVAEALATGAFPTFDAGGPAFSEICDFVFMQIDWILQFQLSDRAASQREAGGFSASGPATISSATYTEAVIRACGLAERAGDQERLSHYRDAARRGLSYILGLQIVPGTEGLFPRPDLVIGAATNSHISFLTRCDHDQHLLTACLTAAATPALWA